MSDLTPVLIDGLATRFAEMSDAAFSGLMLAAVIVGIVGLAALILIGNLSRND